MSILNTNSLAVIQLWGAFAWTLAIALKKMRNSLPYCKSFSMQWAEKAIDQIQYLHFQWVLTVKGNVKRAHVSI